jgi:uncharacterized protein
MRALVVVLCVAGVAAADSGPDEPTGARRRAAAAMQRLQAKCERDDGAACAWLADHYTKLHYSRDTRPEDGEHACALYEKSCRLGSVEGCTGLGASYQGLCGIDFKRAIQVLEPACTAGHKPACGQLASVYRADSEGGWTNVHQDRRRAREMFKQLCDGDVAGLGCLSGCDELASEAYYGDGLQRNRVEAARLHQRACEAGCMNSCDDAARMLHEGDGIPRDDARAAPLWAKACEGGFAPSCADLGELYRDGHGVARDPARARQLFRRACARSHGQVSQCGGDPTAKRLLSF